MSRKKGITEIECCDCNIQRPGHYVRKGKEEVWICHVCANISDRKRQYYGDKTIVMKSVADPVTTGKDNMRRYHNRLQREREENGSLN